VEKIIQFSKNVKSRPCTAEEWYQMGLSFENARGHELDIASCFREATLLDPKLFMAWLKLGIIEQNHYRWEKASLKYLMRLNFDQLTPRQISDSLKFMRNWTRSRLPSNTQEKRLKPVVHTGQLVHFWLTCSIVLVADIIS